MVVGYTNSTTTYIPDARQIREGGYDGIFLDTIDTASAFPQTKEGMIRLVQALRTALPDAPIVLNQGFPLLAQPLDERPIPQRLLAATDFSMAPEAVEIGKALKERRDDD